MSSFLILLVAGIYFITAGDLLFRGQYGLALTFGAYAVSNIGLYIVARGI